MSVCACSWNIGPAHIISFSTEVYFYLEYGLDLLFKQYEWLKKDLEVGGLVNLRAANDIRSITSCK